jgi:hypothetical protein
LLFKLNNEKKTEKFTKPPSAHENRKKLLNDYSHCVQKNKAKAKTKSKANKQEPNKPDDF